MALKSIFLSLFHRTKQLIRRKIYQRRRKAFSDIFQVTDFLNLRGLVATVDINKAFDSVNPLF